MLFIEDAKPASRHITRLDIALDTRVPAFYGCALTDGDVLDILPCNPPISTFMSPPTTR